MIVLSETTDKIEIVLREAVTTNQLQCFSSWRDITSTTFVAGRTSIASNNTTDVTIVGSPGSSTQRVIDTISIYNADTVEAQVQVKIDCDGTEYLLCKNTILPGETLTYVDKKGWDITDGYQQIKGFTIHGSATADFVMTNATLAERNALNTTRNCFAVDLKDYSQVRLRANKQVASASAGTPVFKAKFLLGYNVTASGWAELGTTPLVIDMSTTGYEDTGWVNLNPLAKNNGTIIVFTEAGGDAVEDPALGATDILFR